MFQKITLFRATFSLTLVSLILAACSNGTLATLPDPPASAKQVEAFIKGKKLSVEKVGFYSALTVNGKTEMDWIDSTADNYKDDKMVLGVLRELNQWSMEFGNDTSGTVLSKGKPYASKWVVDETARDDEKPGVRIRVSFKDPELSFGGEPMEVTYSYLVKGVNEKQLLLELPRAINRRELTGLMNLQ